MKVLLLKKDKIHSLILPNTIFGNYILEDRDEYNNKRSIINVEADNGKWKITSNIETQIIVNKEYQQYIYLQENAMCTLLIKGDENPLILYCTKTYDDDFIQLQTPQDREIVIGSGNNQISYNIPVIDKKQAKLTYQQGKWNIENLNLNCPVYLNNIAIANSKINNGDYIFIVGLKIVILGDTILVNNPNNLVTYKNDALSLVLSNQLYTKNTVDDDENLELYSKKDFYFRAPRFKNMIEEIEVEIEAPPSDTSREDMPLIYTLGPMLTMGMTSVVSLSMVLDKVSAGEQTMSQSLPALIMSGAMLCSMILWPILRNRYERRKKKKNNRKISKKYKEYIEEKKNFISTTINSQKALLNEKYLSLDECKLIVEEKRRNLWERKIEQDDFLSIRLGIGKQDPKLKLKYPNERFTVDENKLKVLMDEVVSTSTILENVPISHNFSDDIISAIIGEEVICKKYIEGMILQFMTFHNFEELKIIVLTSEDKKERWNYIKNTPYNWTNNHDFRFFASNIDECNQISAYLEEKFNTRKSSDKDFHDFECYYLIFTDSFNEYRSVPFVKNVIEQTKNKGFSIIINSERLTGLPTECTRFLNINNKIKSNIYGNELIASQQVEFIADIDEDLNIEHYMELLANIPMEFEHENYNLPESVSFLKMYNVGKVENLNAINRWKNNNSVMNLQAPVGIGENGDVFKLDLHEKFHGPHGLIAGMTGSGKSEFIITYILSLAVNYSPDDVAFVLIDYKGGGLVGAFENKETGISLPHLAGTITNLDTGEMNRALISIQSELKRRQSKFNKARELLNEGTIDIYKYQRLYHEGKVEEPIPHLFIISDEFAELKAQRPEFMEQLISTARIGRSLGVHLILATQKPSGVVNEQIWSNSRFRVCLKVQEKADSMDMIKSADAAALKNVGRFYLQVGYNELYALGQSAWCGAPYYETDILRKKMDTNISFIDNTGYIYKNINNVEEKKVDAKGEELGNIVNYLHQLANQKQFQVSKLWLDAIPSVIIVDQLKKKYNYSKNPHFINPIIGEYDDPANQKQSILTLPLSKKGNTLIVGAAGSGKELLISSAIYSMITTYSLNEINIYILDFGAGVLKVFGDAPQVGDIITIDDSEKIENLFKMLENIITERKQLFANYNGDYQSYCNQSGSVIPTIVIALNNFEQFQELYLNYVDVIIQLTRDCFKYGIIFILTSNSGNSVSYRIKQNFGLSLSLQLSDEMDYYALFGSTGGLVPAKYKGRGLIKEELLYEFQTAYPAEPEKMNEYLKNVCAMLKSSSPYKARAIPTLPEIVTLEMVEKYITDLTKVPIGIQKNNMKIEVHNFSDSATIITANKIKVASSFIENLIKEFEKININVYVIDCEKLLENNFTKAKYSNSYKNIIDSMLKDFNKKACFVIGLDKLASKNVGFDVGQFFDDFRSTVNFVICDSANNIKKYEYNPWFSKTVDTSSGIWVGDGFASQAVFKLTSYVKSTKNNLNFGYHVKEGQEYLTKLLGDMKDE